VFIIDLKAKNGSESFLKTNKNIGIFQGEPVDFDKTNDYSIDSSDRTPTVDTVKISKFMKSENSITRAKELVSR